MENTTKTEEKFNIYDFFTMSFIFGTIISICILFGMVLDRPDRDEINGNINLIAHYKIDYFLQSAELRQSIVDTVNEKEFKAKCDKEYGRVREMLSEDADYKVCIVDNVIKDTYSISIATSSKEVILNIK